jgi:hypothetical protein
MLNLLQRVRALCNSTSLGVLLNGIDKAEALFTEFVINLKRNIRDLLNGTKDFAPRTDSKTYLLCGGIR